MPVTLRTALRPRCKAGFFVFLVSWLITEVGFAGADLIKIEVETAQGVTLNGVQIVTTRTGYSGTDYAWGFDDDSHGGNNLVFSVPATAGAYELTIGYYSPHGDKKTG